MNLPQYGKYHKPRNISIKPEDIILNKQYAFSLNPNEQIGISCQKYVYFKRYVNTYHDWVNQQEKFIKTIKGAEIDVVIEVSQLGRLHFHGYIKIINPFLFYIKEIPLLKHHGTFVIKEIKEPEVWKEYLKKQSKIFKKVHHQYADSKYRITSQEEIIAERSL